MKNLFQLAFLIGTITFQSCIGTDLIDDPIIDEKLTILPRIDSLIVGQEQVFTTSYTNQYGMEASAGSILWSSSKPENISIDALGKASGIAPGKATIYASFGGLKDSLVLNGGVNNNNQSDTSFFKQGIFMTVNSHYFAKGKLYVQTVNGQSKIRTDVDFGTSAGPSVYLLLANHKSGSYTVTPGGHAINTVSAQITANKLTSFSGVQTWAIPAGVNPANYKFAILYCVLGPVFGAAELQ